jgi:hypothetical protein
LNPSPRRHGKDRGWTLFPAMAVRKLADKVSNLCILGVMLHCPHDWLHVCN